MAEDGRAGSCRWEGGPVQAFMSTSDQDRKLSQDIRRVSSAVADVETWLATEDELSALIRSLARRLDEAQMLQERRLVLRNVEVHELYAKMAQQRMDAHNQAECLMEVKELVASHHDVLRELCDSSEHNKRELQTLKALLVDRQADQTDRVLDAKHQHEDRLNAIEFSLERLAKPIELSAVEREDRLSAMERSLERLAKPIELSAAATEDRLSAMERSLERLVKPIELSAAATEDRLKAMERSLERLAKPIELSATVTEDLCKLKTSNEDMLHTFQNLRSHTDVLDAKHGVVIQRLDALAGELCCLFKFKADTESLLRTASGKCADGQKQADRESKSASVDDLRKEHTKKGLEQALGCGKLSGSPHISKEQDAQQGHHASANDLALPPQTIEGALEPRIVKPTASVRTSSAAGQQRLAVSRPWQPLPSASPPAPLALPMLHPTSQALPGQPAGPLPALALPTAVPAPECCQLSPHRPAAGALTPWAGIPPLHGLLGGTPGFQLCNGQMSGDMLQVPSSPSDRVFQLLDANHDGVISQTEWRQAFTKP